MANQDLISYLLIQSQTLQNGRICLRVPSGEKGYIYLKQGSVIHADSGSAIGPRAFFTMLLWPQANLAWQSEEKPSTLSMNETVYTLLFQLAQIEDSGNTDPASLVRMFPDTTQSSTKTLPDLSNCYVYLFSVTPGCSELEFSLIKGDYVIGQAADSTLCIPHETVSRRHALLTIDDNCIRLNDLGSSNGTYVNGELITECILSPGDRIQFGGVDFELNLKLLRNLDHGDPEQTHEVASEASPKIIPISSGASKAAALRVTAPIRFEDLAINKAANKSILARVFGGG